MRESPEFLVHDVSVVVTAGAHNPSSFIHESLVAEQIVPTEWIVSEALTTPAVSTIRYSHGVRLVMERTSLQFIESCEAPPRGDYEIHQCALDYLTARPSYVYQSLGLNCRLSTPRANPGKWLADKFLNEAVTLDQTAEILGLQPTFSLRVSDATCNLDLRAGERKVNDDASEEVVLAEVNFHHEQLEEVDLFKAAIGNWSEKQELMLSILSDLLGKER